MSAGMEGLRDLLADTLANSVESFRGGRPWSAHSADALLAPDGPLFPALRALGLQAAYYADPRGWLGNRHVTGPLALACLAAAEMEGP